MPVKVYDGTNWVTVAGDGQQGPAATSSSIATWVKTASGGETSLSGNDDNSASLSYTSGQELVYINGVLQKRAVDYVATTGTTITGLNALAASDVVTVWTVNAFSVTNAIPNSTITAKGDLIVGTGSGTYTAQAVGANGQVLTADSTSGDGVAWAAIPSGAVVQVKSANITTSQSTTSATFVDSTITLSITPTSASNKILVLVTVVGTRTETTDGGTKYGRVKLFRGATAIQNEGNPTGYYVGGGSGGTLIYEMYGNIGLSYIDSPATTSATTYKLQYKADNGTFTLAGNAAITLMEVTP